MAKDPAFLFYPNDWLGGTMHFSRHLKGCYIELLIAQFNNGPLSLETIKAILGQDQASWTVLSKKFKQDSEGNFSNERLAAEIEKREKFSQSRRDNINKRYSKPPPSTSVATSVEQVNVLVENENEDCIKGKGVQGERVGFNTMPYPEDLGDFPTEKIQAIIEALQFTKQYKITERQILGLWPGFKIENLTGKKFYQNPEEVHRHFSNWIKKQDFSTPINSSAKISLKG